jgi:flagellar biosynthesis/type III secretory pathway M-ring protein FliF/YscJ
MPHRARWSTRAKWWMHASWETLNMVDLINVLLRAVMCIAFIMWVVRPMLMTFSRRELDHAEIEEAAQMAITSAFQAYSHNNTTANYYDNPQLAVYMAQNPDLHIPTDEEMAQRQKAALEQAQADEAAAQLAAANPLAELVATEGPAAGINASADVATDDQLASPDGLSSDATAVAVLEASPEEEEAETMEQMRERVKLENKQKRPTIPPELLQNANSYEDQLMVVRMIVDQEQSRVASVIRNMIQVK